MPRAIWSGAISFGLVNVPVKLHSAVSAKEVHFHMLHDADGARIQQKRVCSADGKEVPYEHVVKGYELSRGKYVMVTREELEAFDPEASRTIDIEDFVELAQIDPVYYEHTYYLVPDKGAAKPYALLHAAMVHTGKVAIARMVMRTKQYLCAVRPLGRSLAVSTMQYADEVVPVSDLEGLPAAGTKPAARELQLAEQLVKSLARDFEPKRYKDEYREKVLGMIERKAKGDEIVVDERAVAHPAKTVDLFEALKASLAPPRKEAAAEGAKERAPRRRGPAVRKAAGPRRAATRRSHRAA